jgi:hypothetical protein
MFIVDFRFHFWMFFVHFPFCFWCFQKLTAKFRYCLDWFEILKFQTWQWRKVKKSISQLPICHLGWLAVLDQSVKTLVVLFVLRTVSNARIIDYGTECFATYKFQLLEGSFEKGALTLSITTFSITILSTSGSFITLGINDTEHT